MNPAGAGLRASDGDRERTVERLRDHAGEGRLEMEELEQRIQSALAARTTGELEALVGDLPRERSGGSRRHGRREAELRAFAAVSLMLIAIWAFTGMGYFWPIWPVLGWGVPLLLCSKPGRKRSQRGYGRLSGAG